MSHRLATRFALATLAVLAVAACSDDNNSPPPNDTGPTAAQITELGLATEDNIGVDLDAFSINDLYTPIGYATAAVIRGPAGVAPPACVTLNPATPTDADQDSIPDDVTITFACSASNARFTLARTGALRIQDTNQENGFDLTQTLTDLAWSLTDNSGNTGYSATWNGSRARAGDADTASLTVDLSVVRARTGQDTATITRTGAMVFAAADGDSLLIDQPLPNGTVTINGAQHWVRGSEDFTFTVSTIAPLVYDASCVGRQRFTAGEVHLASTVHNSEGYLKLVWTACDVGPTRSWVGTPTS